MSQSNEEKIFLRGLVNATLSSRVYLESIKNLKEDIKNNPYDKGFNFTEEDVKKLGENYFLAKKLNAQLSQYFNPISAEELDFNKNLHHYEDGIYKLKIKDIGIDDNNETRFSMGLFSSEIDQDKTLHIVFRGTEPKYEKKMLYFGYDYLNMERHYKAFGPLIEKALEYAKKSNIKHIEVAGHSLGGAMVDLFLRKNKEKHKEKFEINGYSFGNPYGHSSVDSSIKTVDSCVEKLDNSQLGKFKAFKALGAYAIGVSSLALLWKLAINYVDNVTYLMTNSIEKLFFGSSEYKIDNDTRYVPSTNNSNLISFNHTSDPVVIAGAIAYETSGNRVLLSDINNVPQGKIKSINPFKGIGNILNILGIRNLWLIF